MLPTFSQAPERGRGGGLDRAKDGVFLFARSPIALQLVVWVKRGGLATQVGAQCGGHNVAWFGPQEGDSKLREGAGVGV